jgi:hypothetical protein
MLIEIRLFKCINIYFIFRKMIWFSNLVQLHIWNSCLDIFYNWFQNYYTKVWKVMIQIDRYYFSNHFGILFAFFWFTMKELWIFKASAIFLKLVLNRGDTFYTESDSSQLGWLVGQGPGQTPRGGGRSQNGWLAPGQRRRSPETVIQASPGCASRHARLRTLTRNGR